MKYVFQLTAVIHAIYNYFYSDYYLLFIILTYSTFLCRVRSVQLEFCRWIIKNSSACVLTLVCDRLACERWCMPCGIPLFWLLLGCCVASAGICSCLFYMFILLLLLFEFCSFCCKCSFGSVLLPPCVWLVTTHTWTKTLHRGKTTGSTSTLRLRIIRF